MINIPKSTELHKILPKEAFYKNLVLSTSQKNGFVTDIKRIILQNKLAPSSLNIAKGVQVSEILVLAIELKKQQLDYKIIEAIAKQNNHKIVFILKFQQQEQLLLWYNRLYKTQWQPNGQMELSCTGRDLDEVWERFVIQITGLDPQMMQTGEFSLDQALTKKEEVEKLTQDIEKLEKLARTEKQPKKKFELVQELQKAVKELEELS